MAYSPYNDPHFQAVFFREIQENKRFKYDWQEYVGYKVWLRELTSR